ncbi:MAG TPA: hypothetical protein V6D26_31295 [Stenomitos sp.]
MAVLTVTIPVIHKAGGNYTTYNKQGELTCSLETNEKLQENYDKLRQEANELLEQIHVEYRLAENLKQLENAVRDREEQLRGVERDIKRAQAKLQRVKAFLGRLGIDATAYGNTLEIEDSPLLEASVSESDEDEGEDGEDDIPI